MSRFVTWLAWLAVAIASAFLLIASTALSLSVVTSLGFAVGLGIFVVSIGIAISERARAAATFLASLIVLISAWTVVASLVFAQGTVQHLVLASSIAIVSLSITAIVLHEFFMEQAIRHGRGSMPTAAPQQDSRLAAA